MRSYSLLLKVRQNFCEITVVENLTTVDLDELVFCRLDNQILRYTICLFTINGDITGKNHFLQSNHEHIDLRETVAYSIIPRYSEQNSIDFNRVSNFKWNFLQKFAKKRT